MLKERNSPDVDHLMSRASARTQAGDQSCSKCFKDIMRGIGYKGLEGQIEMKLLDPAPRSRSCPGTFRPQPLCSPTAMFGCGHPVGP